MARGHREEPRRNQPKRRRARRKKFLRVGAGVLITLLLVLGIPYQITRMSMNAIIQAGTAALPPRATPMTRAPRPIPTPVPSIIPAREELPSPMPTPTPRSYDKMIALTFDDGPGLFSTENILWTLEKAGARATFFLLGENAQARPELARRIAEAGHQIGTHTHSHKSLIRLSPGEMRKEVALSLDSLQRAAGVRPVLLRPPYGNVNDSVRENMAGMGLPLICWSLDTRDWESRDAEKVYQEVMGSVRDGDIILMHDLYDSTAEAVARLVPELMEAGYELVTLDELFAAKGLSLEAGTVYHSAR